MLLRVRYISEATALPRTVAAWKHTLLGLLRERNVAQAPPFFSTLLQKCHATERAAARAESHCAALEQQVRRDLNARTVFGSRFEHGDGILTRE